MARLLGSRIASAVVIAAAVIVAAVAVAAPPAPNRSVAVAARSGFDRTIAEAKAAMLGDPVRAAKLAHSAGLAAASWPTGVERDIAVASAQWLEGEGAYRANDIVTAQPLIVAALTTAERVAPGSKLNADLLLSRARIAVEQGKPQAGLGDLQRAYAMFVKLGDARSESRALQSIGSIYQDAQDFSHVLYYYRLASEIYPVDPTLNLSASNNIANAYARMGRLDEAEGEFKRALVIAKQLKSVLLTARILDNIADLEIDHREYISARASLADGIELASQPKAASWLPMLLGTRARLELAQGHPETAVRTVEAAFARADNSTTDQAYRPVHLTAYRAYKLTGDYGRALWHLEVYRQLDDAGRTLATSTSSALMAAQFDFANQNVRIATLKTGQLLRDVALARLQARQSALILAALATLVVIAAVFLFVYLRSQRRSRNKIVAANLQLAQSNTELAEALLAKSQFLATTSHEIRTPLNGILGMTQVMLADRTVTGDMRDRIGLVHSAGRSMRALVDDILDFAKMDAGAVTITNAPVDIAAVLPDLVALWRVEAVDKGIDLVVDVASSIVPIVTDGVRVRQIVFNLLSNAVKFTSKGSVRIVCRPETDDGIEYLVMSFSDTGVGVPVTAFETIFEPFRQLDTSTTRQFGGTGLGLAISRHLARALGGDITVESKVGAGSTFSLQLPYIRAGAADNLGPNDADGQSFSRRLLIVGANPIGRSMLRARLDPHFDACTTCDIDETPARIEQDVPNYVLIEVDGLFDDDRLATLLRHIADGREEIGVTVLCVAAAEERAAELASGGRAGVVVKPVSIETLVDKINASQRFHSFSEMS